MSGVPLPPGGNGFDGSPDLLVGEISTIRTFDLQADGTLWGLMHFGRPWVAGTNTAVCAVHERAGARGCRCGFWSYAHRSGIAAQPTSGTITAVVDNWGRITPGTRGIRAEHAAIRALYLAAPVSDRLVGRVADRYPGVAIYRDEDAMLTEHPLTELEVFDSSPLPSALGRGRVRMVLVVMLALTLALTFLARQGHDAAGHPSISLVVLPVLIVGSALARSAQAARTGTHDASGTLLSPGRAVAHLNSTFVLMTLFATFLLPGAPVPTLALSLLVIGSRALRVRRFTGTVPVRYTPGGLVLRAVSPRYRRALRAAQPAS